ncbi:MAG: DUF1080 domain-containing protein [Chitinophagaceae bacterium]
MANRFISSIALLLTTFFSSGLFAQGITLSDWSVLSDENKNPALKDTVFLGKPCVQVDGKTISAIWNKKVNMKNFQLEFDMAGAVMGGLGFRASDEQNYQFLYFRPGYGNTIEAIQYIPIYNGALSWVFYSEYQASADIQRMQWFHASIQVMDDHLKVFVNGNKKADMDIRMQHADADRGSILLRSMFGVSYFANVYYRELPEGITDWEISEQLPAGTHYGYEQVKKISQWKPVNQAGDDYVNLCRYFKQPEGTVIAKHTVHAENAQEQFLSFDFTGTMQIFLNGKSIFNYDKYKLDRVDAGTYRIKLPLQKGNNELVMITQGDSYIFGKGFNSVGRLQHQNWGFIAGIGN